MCGRYVLRVSREDIQDVLPDLEVPADLEPRYNIAPTQACAVVPNEPTHRVELFAWGLVPSWAKDRSIGNRMINARVETVAEKPAYKRAFKSRRCLVVADGFYEWRKEAEGPKTPHLFRREDGRPFTFAGLWERWKDRETGEELRSFTILTGPPNDLVRPVHDRMPVVIAPDVREAWIAPEPRTPDDLLPLCEPWSADGWRADPVSRVVNDPRNDVPDCVEPVQG